MTRFRKDKRWIKKLPLRRKVHNYLHITLTLNNIFANFTDGVGNCKFVMSLGTFKFTGAKKRRDFAIFRLGLFVGEELALRRKKKKNRKKEWGLILHNASGKSQFRFRFFWKAFKHAKIRFRRIVIKTKIAYNGCKVKKFPRTGRKVRTILHYKNKRKRRKKR